MEDEGKQVLPMLERLLAPSTDSAIVAGPVLYATALHASPDEGSRLPELPAGDGFLNEGMPAGKQAVDISKHDGGGLLF
jgi:hypothetical protein